MIEVSDLEVRLAEHGKEGGHWWTRQGQLVESVPYADPKRKGEMRKATLKDARKLNLLPGITGICSLIYRPGLERWKIDEAIDAALRVQRQDGEEAPAHRKRIQEAAREKAENAARMGTIIHAAIQEHFTTGLFPEDPSLAATVTEVRRIVRNICDERPWCPEKSLVCSLGFASKADLCCPEFVWDFKGKDGDERQLLSEELYDEHFMQLAATRHGLGQDYARANCGIIFVSRTHPGVVVAAPVKEQQLQRGWRMFQLLHELWCIKNDYFPGWKE